MTLQEIHKRYDTSEKGRARRREYSERKRRKGQCHECSEPAMPGCSRCVIHKAEQADRDFLRGGK